MIKYYFGYNEFNGRTFPVKWMEEDGKAVGGKPSKILQQVRITALKFNGVDNASLANTYPLKEGAKETDGKV